MNIFVLGVSDGGCMMANLLLQNVNVNKVYHYGANSEAQPTDRYIPLSSSPESKNVSEKTDILNYLDALDIDLVIPTTFIYLLWNDLHVKLKDKNISFLGTSREIAMLEWSKISSKSLLKQLEIPTPDYKVYDLETLLLDFLNIKRPFVFKYDKDERLGGQTVIVTDDNYQEEYDLLKTTGTTRFGGWKEVLGTNFSSTFVVESFIEGVREYSYHAICNSANWQYIGSARDYKKRFENDVGFNTVGLGAYAKVETNPIVHTYVDKILSHLKENGKEWVGIMYLGIMEDANGTPHVLEINTRFGNPELQVILPLINNNLTDLFYNAANNKHIDEILFKDQSAVALRIIHKDYPHSPPIDTTPIYPTLPNSDEIFINFPAHRKLFNSSLVALGNSVIEASDKIYSYLKDKEMHDYTYRYDIGRLK